MRWRTLDTEALLKRREEQTTTANVGAFVQPLGPGVLRRCSPAGCVDQDGMEDIPDDLAMLLNIFKPKK